MGKTVTRIFIATLALISAAFAVNVNVSSPSNGATVTSPATIRASASSGSIITGWRIYVDGNSVYQAGATSSITAAVPMSAGSHQVIVRAWDATGTYASQNLQLTAGSSGSPSTSPSAVNVNVTSPTNGASVGSPATFTASASSGAPITGWRIYVDGNSAYSAGAQSSISASVPMGAGAHQVIVRAWNSNGVFGSASMTVNVGGSTGTPTTPTTPTTNDGGPVPPAHAKVFSKIEEMGGWGNCRSLGCSGSDSPASYWMAQNQSNPSLDGSSTLFNVSGAAWADVLWYKSLGPVNTASKFLLDYWLKPNPDTLTRAEALEFDIVQSMNGRKWDFSNQLHYNTQHWDTWDGVALKWVHTNMPAPKLDPNKWHHIKIFVERVGTQTHYISYTVDGVNYPIPNQYAWQNTVGSNWADAVVVQVQMDVNANPGTISEYVDKLTLYAW